MDFSFSSAFNEEKNWWEVTPSGEIDIFNSNEFRERLTELIKSREADLYIRCGGLSYIDSTALGAMVSVLKAVKLYGGEIRLSGLKSSISKLFRITNLDKAFIIEGEPNE